MKRRLVRGTRISLWRISRTVYWGLRFFSSCPSIIWWLCQEKSLARPACGFGLSLDERVGEEEHQGNDQAVNGQGLHECQGQQQHTSQVICHLRLTGDAINASSGSNALANTGTDRCQANGEASANGRQGRDPHWALVSECCLWCHQSRRGQSCCSSSVCGRRRCMGAARGRHESSQECSAAQQHGTSQDEGASHSDKSTVDTTGDWSWYWRTWAMQTVHSPFDPTSLSRNLFPADSKAKLGR